MLDALAQDTHYKYLVILLIPVTTCCVIVNWWGLKVSDAMSGLRHAQQVVNAKLASTDLPSRLNSDHRRSLARNEGRSCRRFDVTRYVVSPDKIPSLPLFVPWSVVATLDRADFGSLWQ